ncbi:hypothetical protein L1887_42116 [Cichorium endivia]|nr:hypothetical protein L1887_42116 [Cichorium endivia]
MTEQTTSASLNIIDLAGSERASATRNNGARMKEGANINKSLLALGNCINALCQSGGVRKHVPYRNSKLTRLLKFSLGGNCKTVMVVCISPSSAHYEETHNALKYANQAKNIRTKVSRNMINVDRHVAQYVQAIHELKEENERLRAKLQERGSLESAAEKRKRAEMGREVDDAKKRMRESTDSVTRLVTDKAALEAITTASETRIAELRKRLGVVEADLAQFSARGEVLPSDLEGERDVLRKMVAAEERTLHDEATAAGVRSLTNSLQMQRGIIVAASHNQKFDAEASETIQTLGNAMLAEVEAQQAKAKLGGMLDVLRRTTAEATQLVAVATRSTIALREVAGELEYRATHASEDNTEELSSTLALLASQLRSIAGENDKVFETVCGASLAVVAPQPAAAAAAAVAPARQARPPLGSTLRRSRTSLALAPANAAATTSHSTNRAVSSSAASGFGRAATAASSRRASLAPVVPRSTSMHAGSSPAAAVPAASASAASTRPGFAAPTSSSSARSHAGAGSPGRAPPVRRVSAAARRLSTARPARAVSAAPTAPVEEKKKFRWADEAGEGAIDDQGLGRAVDAQAESGASSSSGAEWEDLSDGRTTPATAPEPSTSAAVSTQAAVRSASLGSSSGKLAGFPGGKRSVSTASALSPLREAGASADEADVSGASPVGAQRMPLAPATGALNAALPLFGGINADTFNASVAVKKAFPRPSAGGPGPIRRRTRTSVAVAALGHPSLAAPAPAAAMARVPGQSGVGDRVKATRVVAPAMRASPSLFS